MATTFLKKYKVVQKIGEGSFSEVLKCQDRLTGASYAAKRLKRIYNTVKEILESPEVIAMQKINRHPNVLHMIESHYDPLPGKVTLIFELMDMTLDDLIKARKGRVLMETKVKSYMYQLLKGLDHLHKYGIFHRDIKPENILVKGEVVKLADLGSIRGIYSRPPYTEYISTRWYRSPECLLTTGFYGPKMDVWALGCVYYELLTLKPLFPGSNEIDQIAKIHAILGTPHARIVAKFRRHKSKNCEFFFPNKNGTGFVTLIPHASDSGKELMKMMLVYDPENRSNVKRLLEHRYFADLREHESPRHTMDLAYLNTSPEGSQWRNPMLMSYITSEKRRKGKPLSTRRPNFLEDLNSKIPRIVASSTNARPTVSGRSNISKIAISERGDSVSMLNAGKEPRNLWRRNIYSTRTARTNESSRSTYSTRLPIIKYNATRMEDNGDTARKITSKASQPVSHYNLRSNHKAAVDRKNAKEINNQFLPEIKPKVDVKRRLPVSAVTSSHEVKIEVGKKNSRLTTITEAKLPLYHIGSANVKSPFKKMAKHETPTNFDTNKKSVKRVKGK